MLETDGGLRIRSNVFRKRGSAALMKKHCRTEKAQMMHQLRGTVDVAYSRSNSRGA